MVRRQGSARPESRSSRIGTRLRFDDVTIEARGRENDMSIGYSAPSRLLDLADWDALPLDEVHRVELVEGVLIVSPRSRFLHQDAVLRVAMALRQHLPPQWRALIDIEVLVEGGPVPTVRMPDLAVVPAHIVDQRSRCDASLVVAIVEVLSPGTRRTDRIMKAAEYASAGVPTYVLVDPEGGVTTLTLRDGAYREVDALEIDGTPVDLT